MFDIILNIAMWLIRDNGMNSFNMPLVLMVVMSLSVNIPRLNLTLLSNSAKENMGMTGLLDILFLTQLLRI